VQMYARICSVRELRHVLFELRRLLRIWDSSDRRDSHTHIPTRTHTLLKVEAKPRVEHVEHVVGRRR